MAVIESEMIPLGTKAPDFNLKDATSGQMVILSKQKSDVATVVMFICNHCPFVKHIQKKLAEVAQSYQKQGVVFLGINANDFIAYPSDSPENMKRVAAENDYSFPYLIDETQDVARAYNAVCTPEFYIFDANLKCIYRGRFDDSTPGNGVKVTGNDLTTALDQVLKGQDADLEQIPSRGCSIKWKP
ncbi:MAG: thioredoxin family protein [Pseudomonadota bacterium]